MKSHLTLYQYTFTSKFQKDLVWPLKPQIEAIADFMQEKHLLCLFTVHLLEARAGLLNFWSNKVIDCMCDVVVGRGLVVDYNVK